MNKRGTILIVTLWILVILTVFALALGQRASLEVKLAGYARDKLRATELAKAAIERVIYEKLNDTVVKEVDALSESWANIEALKELVLGDENFSGTITVSYSFDGIGDEEKTILYGMEDEQSKININQAEEAVLKRLWADYENKDEIVDAILAWRSSDLNDGSADYAKNEYFKSLAELLLVPGITPEMLYGEDKNDDGKIGPEEEGLARYLTVFGEGKVNINTASKKVLLALTDNNEDLVEKIIKYRKGSDEEIGTEDDRWFATSDGLVNLLDEPAKNLNVAYNVDQLFDVSLDQWQLLQGLISANKLSVSSTIYTIHAQAEVNKVKSLITATVEINPPSNPVPITYLFWQKN